MSQDRTIISRSNRKSRLPFVLGCSALLGVLLVLALLGGYFYTTTSASGQSIISIRSPHNGEILATGEPVQVSALARDDDNVTRIELWVDSVLVDVQESNTPGGINPFPLLTTWYPTEGSHTLIVRAFDGRNNPFQATIYVGATVFADRDGDGIADDADACPDEAGSEAADGCPDRDFDGITDATDACPDEAGLPPTGCPEPGESDRDGDGMLDYADACPDEVGSPLANGCPDADGDGTPDGTDACPGEPGAGADGCPEPEGTLPPDPAPGGEEPPPEPRPGDDPPDPADDEAPEAGSGDPVPFDSGAPIPIEIEAYEFQVTDDFENMWCYVRLGEEDPRRYDFEPDGEHFWNIAEELSGENSVRILHEENLPLNLSMGCWGSNTGEEPVSLGEISTLHPPGEWDGREFRRGPFTGGIAPYGVRYRICSPSCDESAFPAPLLAPPTFGPIGEGPYRIGWRWDGDESLIDGFIMRIFGEGNETLWMIYLEDPAARFLDIEDYMPACGETFYFEIFAYGESGHTPTSNTQHWPGDTCTYTAHVTFTTLEVHNPPADEDGLHRPGPIYGNFWISNGTTVESLDFNACWCYFGPGETFWGWCEGLKLQSGTYLINRGIFEWIETAQASCIGNGCNSNDFYAPFSSSLQIPLEDGGDLTVGGRIMDCDSRGNADDVVFEEQGAIRISIDDLEYFTQPLDFGLNGPHINLNSFIRMGR